MIGNIITNTKLTYKVNEDLFYVTNSLDNVDLSKSTLIIGWKFLKKLYPDKKISILDKKIEDNLFWTFNRIEKRVDYEEDIYNFIINQFSTISKTLKYTFIDVINVHEDKLKKVINFINSSVNKHIYICNNSFVYLYSNHFVLGFDINDFVFVSKKELLFKAINSNVNNIIFTSDNFINVELRKLFYDNKIIIPYIHYLIYGLKK